jgi:hypothetical protein
MNGDSRRLPIRGLREAFIPAGELKLQCGKSTLCVIIHLRTAQCPKICIKFSHLNQIFSMFQIINYLLMVAMQVNNHTMVLEWREREHEDDNSTAENHPPTIASLRDCGLLKYFRIPGMRAQVRLLEHLVRMWDPDQQVFIVGAHTLTIDIEDIYFLTGLSRRGAHVSLTGSHRGGMKMSEYCREYCVPEAERKKGKVAIWGVTDITLWTILFTIAQMEGSAAPHMALQRYFQYALECVKPRVFNWADAVLRNLKKQLTKSRREDLK